MEDCQPKLVAFNIKFKLQRPDLDILAETVLLHYDIASVKTSSTRFALGECKFQHTWRNTENTGGCKLCRKICLIKPKGTQI